MRLLDPLKAGLSPESVEELYNIVATDRMCLEAKIDRLKSEISVAICAAEDKKVDLDGMVKGLYNLIAYIETKPDPYKEMNADVATQELINNHLEKVKAHFLKRKNQAVH